MTDDEAKVLGARALATGLWTDAMGLWPEGALDCDSRRIVAATFYDGPIHVYVQAVEVTGANICIEDTTTGPALGVPDFRDDATRGALIGRVREAWCHPTLHLAADWSDRQCTWRMVALRDGRGPDGLRITARTEVETLVAALEAAPSAWPK